MAEHDESNRIDRDLTSDSSGKQAWFAERFLLLLAVVPLLSYSANQPISQTAVSRLATCVSLVHDGTWYIDRPPTESANPFELRTIDKVEIDGRLLSSKPPLLTLLMAGIYAPVADNPDFRLKGVAATKQTVYLMTVFLSILPWTIALTVWCRVLTRAGFRSHTRIASLLILGLASPVAGYAAVLNNHVPAAAMLLLFLCTVLTFVYRDDLPVPLVFIGGICGGLAASFDVPNAIYLLPGIWFVWNRGGKRWIALVAGIAIPVGIQAGLLLYITGSPLPVQMNPEAYLFESSYWRNPLGVDALNEPVGTYLFNMTFGARGLFLIFPVLFVILLPRFVAGFRREPLDVLSGLLLIGFGILTAYYATSTNNYGGESYGFRWYIASAPILVVVGIQCLERYRNRLFVGAYSVALGVSLISAAHCRANPWQTGTEWIPTLLGF